VLLYLEQEAKSIYSGKTIELDRLLSDDDYCQVDHILPYSRTFDNSYMNKVKCIADENQARK